MERRAATQRAHQSSAVLGQRRIDPDLADPWAPEIVLINGAPTVEQSARLIDLLTRPPQVTMAAVLAAPLAGAPWRLRLHASGREAPGRATLDPLGSAAGPAIDQAPDGQRAVLELISATGSEETTPAPWWWHGPQPPHPPPDNVTYLETAGSEVGSTEARTGMSQWRRGSAEAGIGDSHPTLAAARTDRAGGRCRDGPAASGQAVSGVLRLAAGAPRYDRPGDGFCAGRRRGHPALQHEPAAQLAGRGSGRASPTCPTPTPGGSCCIPPSARTGSGCRSSPSAGVNRASDDGLRAALELVTGCTAGRRRARPVALGRGAADRHDLLRPRHRRRADRPGAGRRRHSISPGGRHARALVAAPGDELLLAARIRTEHLAGNPAETERLTLQLAAQARNLGVDLDPETVTLLQRGDGGTGRAAGVVCARGAQCSRAAD